MTKNFDRNEVARFTAQDKQQLIDYYNYLKSVGIFYGEIGYEMVSNIGDFGILGNKYFENYLDNDPNYTVEQINDLKDKFMVKLALFDSDLRPETNDGVINYKAIDDYHYSVLDSLE